jgi:hypothetical protein
LHCDPMYDGTSERVAADEDQQVNSLAGEHADLRSRTHRIVVAAILFSLAIDEPLRKEYLLRRWRGDDPWAI